MLVCGPGDVVDSVEFGVWESLRDHPFPREVPPRSPSSLPVAGSSPSAGPLSSGPVLPLPPWTGNEEYPRSHAGGALSGSERDVTGSVSSPGPPRTSVSAGYSGKVRTRTPSDGTRHL